MPSAITTETTNLGKPKVFDALADLRFVAAMVVVYSLKFAHVEIVAGPWATEVKHK